MKNVDYYAKWAELDDAVAKKEKSITIFVDTSSANEVFISNNPQNERSILIEFEKEVIENYSTKSINGLDINVVAENKIDVKKKYLKLICANKDLDEAFLGFSVTVFNNIEKTKTSFQALTAIDEVIDDYRHFFGTKKVLSKMEEQGLIAELLYLANEVKNHGENAVKNWYGCEKNKRDFIYNDYAVEIKSTRNQKQDIIHISNENQLDKGTLDKLILKLYVFDENDKGYTVDSCIKTVADQLNSLALIKLFYSKVQMHGIDPQNYQGQYCFALEKVKTYEVDDSFPKLIKKDIPEAVFEVGYKVNISGIKPLREEI